MDSAHAVPPSIPRIPHVSQSLARLRHEIVRNRTSYLLLFPFVLLFGTFVVYPILASTYLSLTDYAGTKAPEFVGLDNFSQLLSLDVKPWPVAVDKNTNEPLFKCNGKQVPQSQVQSLTASGLSCTAAFARPSTILAKGYQQLGSFQWGGTTLIVGARDTRFWIALGNTIRYGVVVVALGILLGLGLALALQSQNKLNYLLRTLLFMPAVTSSLAVVTIWRYVFNSEDYGLANSLLRVFGFSQQTFLADAGWTLIIMILFALWSGVGYNTILFLAGLQAIPEQYYEAAAIDGAGRQARFFRITLPLLRPTLLYVIITGTISAFQVFDIVYVLFSGTEHIGGVLDSGLTIVPYLYERGFTRLQLGYATSIAEILFMIIFVLTLINLRIGRANEVA